MKHRPTTTERRARCFYEQTSLLKQQRLDNVSNNIFNKCLWTRICSRGGSIYKKYRRYRYRPICIVSALYRDPSLSADNFRKKLKTHLFRNALGHLSHWRRCVMRRINLRLTYLLFRYRFFRYIDIVSVTSEI